MELQKRKSGLITKPYLLSYAIVGLPIFMCGCVGMSKCGKKLCAELVSSQTTPLCCNTAITGELFIAFVKNFNVADYTDEPRPVGLIILPYDAYIAALTLKQEDLCIYIETVCKYLMKYNHYYMKHFHQSYALLDGKYMELSPGHPKIKGEGNDELFMLREFVEFSGVSKLLRTSDYYAGIHSCLIWEWYYGTYKKDKPIDSDLFVEYVKNVTGFGQTTYPDSIRMVKIPKNVYESALMLKEENHEKYIETVCEYLMGYDEYSWHLFGQSSNLLVTEEVSMAENGEENDALFLLREFAEFSGISIFRKNGFPSDEIENWYRIYLTGKQQALKNQNR